MHEERRRGLNSLFRVRRFVLFGGGCRGCFGEKARWGFLLVIVGVFFVGCQGQICIGFRGCVCCVEPRFRGGQRQFFFVLDEQVLSIQKDHVGLVVGRGCGDAL